MEHEISFMLMFHWSEFGHMVTPTAREPGKHSVVMCPGAEVDGSWWAVRGLCQK